MPTENSTQTANVGNDVDQRSSDQGFEVESNAASIIKPTGDAQQSDGISNNRAGDPSRRESRTFEGSKALETHELKANGFGNQLTQQRSIGAGSQSTTGILPKPRGSLSSEPAAVSRADNQQSSSISAPDGYYQTSRNSGMEDGSTARPHELDSTPQQDHPAPSLGHRIPLDHPSWHLGIRERQLSNDSFIPPEQRISPDLGYRPILPKPAAAHHQRNQQWQFEGLQPVESKPNFSQRTGTTFNAFMPRQKRWRWLALVLFAALIAAIIALGVRVRQLMSSPSHGATTTPAANVSAPDSIVINSYQQGQLVPTSERIAVTDVIIGTFFGPTADKPQTRLVFDGGNGRICVETKIGPSFLPQIKCIENTNAKDSTPLTIVDWLGGPTIVYITKENYLAGFDHVPTNDLWVLSPLGKDNITVHAQTQLSAVTWLNGTSIWIYYQAPDLQLREWGLDDYRDRDFRDGSAGPLGVAQAGSFFGVTRYVIGIDEFEEACYQATNGALHCRRYANSIWGSDVFTIAGTESGLALPASFDYTTVIDPATGNSTVAVAYVKTNGFIAVQSRGTANGTNLGAFTKAVQITEGDGSNTAGVVITGESGSVNVYLRRKEVSGGHIFQYSSDLNMTAWSNGTDLSI